MSIPHSHGVEKPKECEIACPPRQVCDYCQGESGMDTPPAPLGRHHLGDCPFCGARSPNLITDFVPNTNGNRKFLRCLECHAQGPWSTKVIDEETGWDMRAPVSAPSETQQTRAAVLEEAAKVCADLSLGWHETDTPRANAAWECKWAILLLKNAAPEMPAGAVEDYEASVDCPATVATTPNTADAQDAKRYRWLRRTTAAEGDPYLVPTHPRTGRIVVGDELDEYVDEALRHDQRPERPESK